MLEAGCSEDFARLPSTEMRFLTLTVCPTLMLLVSVELPFLDFASPAIPARIGTGVSALELSTKISVTELTHWFDWPVPERLTMPASVA